jgi:hypothetical protein
VTKNNHLTESELFRFLLERKMSGDKIHVAVLRDGERMNLDLLIP